MKRLVLVFALLLAPAIVLAQGTSNAPDPEDFATGSTGGGEAITPIGGFTVPAVEIDFDLMPPGPTTVGDIQAAFPTAPLTDIVLTPPTAGAGNYNFQLNGAALAGDPAGGLNLQIIPENGDFGAVGEMRIVLSEDVFEAGFGIGDWSGPFDVQVWDDGVQVGLYTTDTAAPNELLIFASDVPFDEMVLTALPAFPVANWVAFSIWLPEATVPTVPFWGLMLLAVALLAVSLVVVRRLS